MRLVCSLLSASQPPAPSGAHLERPDELVALAQVPARHLPRLQQLLLLLGRRLCPGVHGPDPAPRGSGPRRRGDERSSGQVRGWVGERQAGGQAGRPNLLHARGHLAQQGLELARDTVVGLGDEGAHTAGLCARAPFARQGT